MAKCNWCGCYISKNDAEWDYTIGDYYCSRSCNEKYKADWHRRTSSKGSFTGSLDEWLSENEWVGDEDESENEENESEDEEDESEDDFNNGKELYEVNDYESAIEKFDAYMTYTADNSEA